jgi:CRISPR-associated protein Csm4
MGQTAIYKLKPRGAFHFGERGVGIEATADLLHSDTLFSALASAWRIGVHEPDPALDNSLPVLAPFVDEQPPFTISSAFPYVGDVLFFPCPLVAATPRTRVLKQVALVSEGALGLLMQGELPDPQRELLQDGRVWITPDERDRLIRPLILEHTADADERDRLAAHFERDLREVKLWSGEKQPAPHVAVDRVNARSNLYFTGRLQFAPGCGLYFWVDFDDPGQRDELEVALDVLQDEGVGGQRSTGHGQFTFERQDRDLPEVADPTGRMTLSLYHPTAAEVSAGILGGASYQRILRSGWIYSPDGMNLRRRSLWMLCEGSILPLDAGASGPPGDVVNLRPEDEALARAGQPPFPHPVWRYGYAFTLPVRWES